MKIKHCLKCNAEFPLKYTDDDGKKHNFQHRLYCLECSPLKEHNTIQLYQSKTEINNKTCPKCQQKLSIECFYKRRGNKPSAYCKKCYNRITLERQHQLKQKYIDYKGGKCEICGYNKCISALTFHHINPDEKEFTISHRQSISFENMKAEIDKCQLLCCNCHNEIHYDK